VHSQRRELGEELRSYTYHGYAQLRSGGFTGAQPQYFFLSNMYTMENYIHIESCDLIQIISKIKIKVINLVLNESAMIEVKSFDDENKLLNTYYFELNGNDYQMWTNDNFIINYVCDKYGFVIKNNL
jgi:hypothetical protein